MGTCETYRAVWASPHLLELELFHACFIGSNRGAFNPHAMFDYGLSCIDSHLIIRLVQRRQRDTVVPKCNLVAPDLGIPAQGRNT